MAETAGETQALFDESLAIFLERERKNILTGVSERNLCGRLALHMDDLKARYGFNAYYVDTEYNRKQRGRIKTILDDQMREIVINCDLILHSRGEIITRDNIIASK